MCCLYDANAWFSSSVGPTATRTAHTASCYKEKSLHDEYTRVREFTTLRKIDASTRRSAIISEKEGESNNRLNCLCTCPQSAEE